MFLQHIRRDDLRVLSALRARDRAKMWYRVDMDRGFVSQYNESAGTYWSFYRLDIDSLGRMLQTIGLSWVELVRRGQSWEPSL